jgi:hypothetical protein
MFDETVREKGLIPTEIIPISNLDGWVEACVKYARIP